MASKQRLASPKVIGQNRESGGRSDAPPVALSWPTWRPLVGLGRTARDEKWPRVGATCAGKTSALTVR